MLALAAIDWSNGGAKEVLLVSELWLLSEAQVRRIEPYFPLSHGILRVDDRRIMSGIIFVISDVTPNYHPVLIRASALLLPMWVGEARGCVA